MSDDELAIAPAPYLVTRRWVKERYLRWGPNHPMYRARVLGEFPEQSELSVYSLAWIEAASHEPESIPDDAGHRIIQVGIDVAGPGEDETVMVARVGGVIIAQHAWSLPDSRGVLVAALGNLRQHRRFRVGPVVVDTVGIGYHVATHLADQGYDVYAFNAGSSPMDSEHFVNAKAEAYWCLRESLERGAIKGLTDEEMQAQLAGIRYRHTPSGRVEIESKEDAKKRGQQSPDRAEALVLAFARAVPRQQTTPLSVPVRISPY
jgi:phage terminase large subunit